MVKLIFHCIIVVLAMAFFIWQFSKHKRMYEFILVLWIPSTLLTYCFEPDSLAMRILGYAQLGLFFLVVIGIAVSQRKAAKNLASSYKSVVGAEQEQPETLTDTGTPRPREEQAQKEEKPE